MAEELLLTMLKNILEDGCWHSDGEGIFEDCANLNCLECFVAKAKPIIEKQERGRILKEAEELYGRFYTLPGFIGKLREHIAQQALKEGA